MASPRLAALLLLLALGGAAAAAEQRTAIMARASGAVSLTATVNPIRRVVTMLQMMQAKVTEEGKKEKELYDKFMCYCKTGTNDLSLSISSADAKITQDTSALQEAEALKAQLETELSGHQSDRADAKEAIAQAKGIRDKEATTFAKEDSDYKTNIAALGKAIAAIEKGAAGGFLQTTSAARVRQMTVDMDLSSADRDMLSAFLSQREAVGYVPRSGEVTGILKQMKETMEKDHADVTATEEKAVKDFGELVAAKEKEIEANTAAIESKTQRNGEVGVNIVSLKEDLDDTTKAMLEDKKFLADLDKNCATKTEEWEARSKTRSEELIALADTIKILNDDDALELFKKTLPSPALLQTKVTSKAVRQSALRILRAGAARGSGGKADPRMDLVMLALAGNAKSFDKVLKMIDSMVELLGKEQGDDDSKKAYCEAELDKTEDDKKALDHEHADLEKAIAEGKDTISTLEEEIAALTAGIKALDKSVAEATDMRKAENSEYKETMAADQAAKELIGVAMNRLAKFYNPALYKPPPKRELSSQDRILSNMVGTEPPTEAPGGIAGTGISYLQAAAPMFAQVSAHRASDDKVAPPPPPETWSAYQKKGQENNGVIAMLEMLMADLDKEMSEMGVEEKEAQKEYEQFMADSVAKRTADSASVAGKEGARAELEAQVQKMGAESKAALVGAMGKAETLKDLHLECDWLLQNHATRKSARAGEVDALKKAKAILSGADFALVQTSASLATPRLRGSTA